MEVDADRTVFQYVPALMAADPRHLSNEQWGTLQTTLASKPPVIVLGPGCHRIGYDHGKPWAQVARRVHLVSARIVADDDFATPEQAQLFLEHLWLSKFSDESLEKPELVDEQRRLFKQAAQSPPKKITDLDRARAALATSIFGVLFESTRCLGNVIATGASPVLHWQAVRHPGPEGSDTGTAKDTSEGTAGSDNSAPIWDARGASGARERARAHLTASVEIASLLEKWSTSGLEFMNTKDQAIREERELDAVELDEKAQAGLARMKVDAIADVLEQFERRCFDIGDLGITGGLVEWLADLFWHLMVTDSGVPPSQTAMAFYVNLTSRALRSERDFGRLRPGETRGTIDESLAGDVQRLLNSYDSGVKKWTDIAPGRKAFLRTIGASVLHAFEKHGEERRVVVLVPDFDLSFERILLELMEPEQALHIVAPIWPSANRFDPEWVFGTVERREGAVTADRMTSVQNWSLYADQPAIGDDDDDVRGPIVIKLNGSPLHRFDGAGFAARIGRPDLEQSELATIFTEVDSLRAIQSFREVANGRQSGLPEDVKTALNWDRNGWVLLGDSFPDWLPRVRLLLNAGAGSESQTRSTHIAVDRQFEFPEIALLDALDVKTFREELSRIARYPYLPTAARESNRSLGEALGDIRNRLDEEDEES